jgi:hypothetical protein
MYTFGADERNDFLLAARSIHARKGEKLYEKKTESHWKSELEESILRSYLRDWE